MIYKMDFSPLLTKLNGEVIEPKNTLGTILAAQLEMIRDNSLPLRKVWLWATELYKTNILELDSVDSDILEKWIENNNNFAALLKCAFLEVFAKGKKDKDIEVKQAA